MAWISFGIKNAEELPNRYPAYDVESIDQPFDESPWVSWRLAGLESRGVLDLIRRGVQTA
jgi:hypothetical protein